MLSNAQLREEFNRLSGEDKSVGGAAAGPGSASEGTSNVNESESASRIFGPPGGKESEGDTFEPDTTGPRGPNGAESVKLETRGLTSQPVQTLLWSKVAMWKHTVATKLETLGRVEESSKLTDCHSRFTVAQCTSCGTVRKFPNRCDQFYCPECQPHLAKERRRAVEWWAQSIGQPKHVTLTVTNTADLTRGHVKQIKHWFGQLRRRKFARNWAGGFYSLEVTNEGAGWHLHIHALVDARWIDGSELARQWCSVTNGAGYIVKVKDCRQADYLAEVTKYAVKGSELAKWKAADIATFIDAFKGQRSFAVFGSLYGKRTEWKEWIESLREHGQTCECGCQKFRFLSEADWILEEIRTGGKQSPRPPPEKLPLQRDFAFPAEPYRLTMPYC